MEKVATAARVLFSATRVLVILQTTLPVYPFFLATITVRETYHLTGRY